jgi:hypothetical protein
VDHSDVGRLAEWLPTVIFEPPLTGYVVALGIGLLLGIERERRKGEGPSRAPAGIRTFAISALLGAIAIHTGGEIAFSVAIAGVVGLTALAYYRSPSEDPGLTSEIALVVAVALGGLAMREQALAAALAVTVAILLTARVPMHRFVREVLTQSELRSILIFAAATLIVWPVIPDRYVGPFAAINPRALWQVVILILAISAVGHTSCRTCCGAASSSLVPHFPTHAPQNSNRPDRGGSMSMGMVHVGNMRMGVAKPLVPMPVRMRLSDWIILGV